MVPHPGPPALLALLLQLAAAPGATPQATRPNRDEAPAEGPRYAVDRWGLEEGLPSEFIRDLVQTGDGYLWMIVSDHLVRFDGVDFTLFRSGEAPGYPFGGPVGLGRGRGDTLWIVQGSRAEGDTARGGRLIERTGGRFTRRGDLVGGPGETGWRGAVQDRASGRLWVFSVQGLSEWTPHGLRPGPRAALANGQGGGDWLPQVAVDRSGTVWLRDEGARVVGPVRNGRIEPLGTEAGEVLVTRPSAGEVLGLRERGDRVEVVDAHGGLLATYRPRSDRIPRLVDRDGRLWVTAAGGVEVYDPGSPDPVTTLPLAPSVNVDRVLEDREGNLWFGTATSGLFRVRTLPFRTYSLEEGIGTRQVRSVARGRDGDVLVVDAESRLYRIRAGRVEPLDAPSVPGLPVPSDGVAAAFVDRRSTLWLSLDGEDGSRYLVGRRADAPPLSVEVPAAARRFVEDRRHPGVLWVATGDGLLRMEPYAAGGPRLEGPFLEGRLIQDVLTAGDDRVWVSTAVGLARLADGKARIVPGTGSLQPRALWEDPGGALWIGTYGHGLLRYRDGELRAVTTADGLADDVVSSLLPDGAGNLWMGGNRSIHRVAIAELEDFLAGRRDRVDGVGYDRRDGLVSPEGSGWPGYRAPDGRLWFPTFGGVAVVDPAAAIAAERVPPLVHVDALLVDGEAVPDTTDLRLEAGRRRVELRYDGVSLRNPEGVRFLHRLDGFDPDWVGPDSARSATYTNLGAGRYVFRVRARSGGGVWSEDEARVSLVVPPLFHETPWFYLLCAMGLVTAVWGVFALRHRALRARQVELTREVDERTRELVREKIRTEEALATVGAQAEQLRSLDEAKSRFFANVSHEFRTPLSLILGPLRDLRQRGGLREGDRRRLDVALSSSERLVGLVDQLLDIARLEAGALRLHKEVNDLVPLLRRVAATWDSIAHSNERRFRVSLPEEPAYVAFDADHIDKVLGNLLSNAFKFTERGGRIALRAWTEDGDEDAGWLVIRVEDDGVGIPADQLGRIFERFHQVDDSASRRHEGVGLGLSLSRDLVELHDGRITVRSAPGRGAAFDVRLPLSPVPASAGAAGTTSEADRGATSPEAGGAGTGEGSEETSILLVEDNDELREYIRGHLSPGYQVVEVTDGDAALEALRAALPDLVVSDVMMPGMDGFELCAAIRADPELAFLPVILLTARASRESRLKGFEEGADDYVVKPFDMRELEARIRNLLRARRRLRERYEEEGRTLPAVEPPWKDAALEEDSAELLAEIHRVLAENLSDEDFQVDDLARALAMSRSTLYRHLRDVVDESPMDLVWSFRLEQAAQWLRETDANVSEVAYGVGFKSVPHFSRRFRERFGVSPSAWRNARDPLPPGGPGGAPSRG